MKCKMSHTIIITQGSVKKNQRHKLGKKSEEIVHVKIIRILSGYCQQPYKDIFVYLTTSKDLGHRFVTMVHNGALTLFFCL